MSRLLWIVLAVIGGGLILLLLSDSSGNVFGVASDNFAQVLYLGVWGTVIAAAILGSGMRFGYVARSLALWMLIILVLIAGYQYRYELQDIASRVTAGLVPGSPISLSDADGANIVMLDKAGNGHFQTRAEINGIPIQVLVDTGATTTVLNASDASRIGFDPENLSYNVSVMTANGSARAARVTAEEIRVGTISRRNVPVLIAENSALDQSLLGMNFIGTLSGFDVRGDRMTLRD
jgi:aspartyl protease family protein